jgi:hypothetical protein
MRIFFDTEFTGLTADAKLISIGLIDESGLNEFYAELADTYELGDCSDFCHREVIPHLQGGAVRQSLSEVRTMLEAWLRARGLDTVLVCDSPRDVTQLEVLLPGGRPANVSTEVLGWQDNLKRRIFNFGRRIHRKLGFRVHHALDDAKVNRLVLMR